MFRESPIVGMGAGSAGDTLGRAFQAGQHVTPHSMFLKVLVEGGILGALAWAGLAITILRRTDWLSPPGRLSLVALCALVGLGLTGSAIDTLPVSFIVFFFAGLAVDSSPVITAKVTQVAPLKGGAAPSDAYRAMVSRKTRAGHL